MAIIPDNSASLHQHLERWAWEHMAPEVRQTIARREQICRGCATYRGHYSKLFIRCGEGLLSLAGDSCPRQLWGQSAPVAPTPAPNATSERSGGCSSDSRVCTGRP